MAGALTESRKRGPTAFLDDPFPVPPHLSKRGRCSPSAATVADLGLCFPLEFDPLDALRLIFPGADPHVLQNYFEASEHVLDAAINGFKEFQLALAREESESAVSKNQSGNGANAGVSSEAVPVAPTINLPTDNSEFAELFIREMSSASDLVDAKNRAFRMLEVFKNSITDRVSPGATQKLHEERKILKQMLGGLLHQNAILKRAYLIQHNRLKDYEEKVQELSQFKQIVDKYQQQMKELEAKNYALSVHLQHAERHNSISGHFNPDVF